MSDLTLNINGNASGAVDAFNDAGNAAGKLGDDVGKSVAQWQELANVAKQAVSAVVKFGVDAVRAFAEAERVQRQLTRVAGEYSDALDAQARALSRLNAVDDDVIKQSQVLLAQWGGVGAATSKVTQAVLDYAAATGQDAVGATQDLIRNVESGGVGLAKLGVHFKTTGDKSKDLAALVDALGKKFGGAGATDAASLSGQLKLADLAFEDTKKSFGGLIGAIESKVGILDKVAGALRGIAEAVGKVDSFGSAAALFSQHGLLTAALTGVYAKPEAPSDAGLPGINTVTGQTNKAMKDAAGAGKKTQAELDDEDLERAKKLYRDLDSIEQHAAEQEAKLLAEREKARQQFVDNLEKQSGEAWDAIEKQEQEAARVAKKLDEEAMKALEASQKDALHRAQERARQWKAAGDQIGAAFVGALTEQLQKLSAGGEFDPAAFIGDILSSVFAIAASAIGTAYGMPALGAAIGNLGAMGIKAGFNAASTKKKPTYHSGGWVGDEAQLPRFHSGSWIGPDEQQAILQHGERVLSRREVSAMGGSGAVDRAARGGGSLQVTINAIDSRSAAEAFERDLGRSVRRAAASGRGDLARLLGVNPR